MTNLLRRLRFRRDHRWTPRHMSAYLDGELVARRPARLLAHIRACPECRRVLRSLERMLGLMRRVPPASPERPDIASAVRRRLRETSRG